MEPIPPEAAESVYQQAVSIAHVLGNLCIKAKHSRLFALRIAHKLALALADALHELRTSPP